MAFVRRHWFSSVLYVLIIVLGMAVWLTPTLYPGGTIETAQAQEAPPVSMDPYLYTRVRALRQALALTNNDLAAMGCTAESATRVLETLKAWCVTNGGQLNQNHQAELRANAALRGVIRQINTGPYDIRVINSLYDLQRDLTTAGQQSRALVESVILTLEAQMSTSQRQVWLSARTNAGQPAPLCYAPDLTDIQRRAIQSRLAARDSVASLNTVINDELTWSQLQALDGVALNASTHHLLVKDAEATVLPMPPELNDSLVVLAQ